MLKNIRSTFILKNKNKNIKKNKQMRELIESAISNNYNDIIDLVPYADVVTRQR